MAGIFNRQGKRNPITEKPLRNAGQSLNEELDRLFNDRMLPYFLAAALFFIATIMNWLSYFSRSHLFLSNCFFTVIATVVIIYASLKIISLKKVADSLNLGLKGEKFIGEFLDSFKEKGYKVYHDIPGESWNIDHVVVSCDGVYTIETKTRMKPSKGEISVLYDGDSIRINGGPPETDAIIQAKAQSRWLREFIVKQTGLDIFIQPVILFPEWWVKKSSPHKPEVWVLNQKALPKFIECSGNSVSPENILKISNAIEGYVRK